MKEKQLLLKLDWQSCKLRPEKVLQIKIIQSHNLMSID